MTDRLPPQLLALFAPRSALRWVPPVDHDPIDRHTKRVSAIGPYLKRVKEVNEKYKEEDAKIPITESWLERKEREKYEKRKEQEYIRKHAEEIFKPKEDPNLTSDPLKTLFVCRLSFDATTEDLLREFGRFGPIETVKIVTKKNADPKASKKKRLTGYAFITFDRQSDMKAAYKATNHGIDIKGRRALVDVERGRTVPKWLPRRLGGGLGGRHYTRPQQVRPAGYGAPMAPGGFSGRGGFGGQRGGFRGGRGGGGFRGGYGGGSFRNGVGFQTGGPNGYGPPDGAPSGPRGGGRPQYGSRPDYDGPRSRFDDRPAYGSGSNREPVGPRGGGGGYRDRDRDPGFGGGRDADSRKRPYDGDGYGDPRAKRRY